MVDIWLPLLVDELREQMAAKISKEENVSICADIWTDCQMHAILAVVVVLGSTREALLFRSIDMGSEKHTAENVAKHLKLAISVVDPQKVGTLVTDDGANMKLARALVQQDYPMILPSR